MRHMPTPASTRQQAPDPQDPCAGVGKIAVQDCAADEMLIGDFASAHAVTVREVNTP
jgi:hypothetical protein